MNTHRTRRPPAPLARQAQRRARALARRVPTPEPAADEVVVRIEATPINPSDIGLLFGAADLATAAVGSGERTVVTARVPERGDEGHGRPAGPVDAGRQRRRGHRRRGGRSAAAQALLGKTVAVLGGAMYSQFRTVKAERACRCRPAPRRPKARRASSTRSPRSA